MSVNLVSNLHSVQTILADFYKIFFNFTDTATA